MLAVKEREALQKSLEQAFKPRAAQVLVNVLEQALEARNGHVTREDFRDLKQTVAELAAAQARTEEAVKVLTEKQSHTDEAVKALAVAQANTEKALQQLARQVGGLSDTVSGDIEDIAYIVLHDVLKREFGWEVGILERSWQTWDGEAEEVDVFGQASDPAHPEQKIWIVGEAKHNITMKEVERFVKQVGRAKQHLIGDVFPVCFCYRVRPEVKARIKEAGLRLVFSYGKLE